MGRRITRLTRLLTLPPGELKDLVRAQWELVVVRLRLRTQPTGELVRVTAETPSAAPLPASSEADLARARALALAVGRAAENGLFRATCLRRATAIQRLLDREGIKGSRVRLGVRNDRGGFAAHAWVELGDTLLGDQPHHVGSFTLADDLRVVNL